MLLQGFQDWPAYQYDIQCTDERVDKMYIIHTSRSSVPAQSYILDTGRHLCRSRSVMWWAVQKSCLYNNSPYNVESERYRSFNSGVFKHSSLCKISCFCGLGNKWWHRLSRRHNGGLLTHGGHAWYCSMLPQFIPSTLFRMYRRTRLRSWCSLCPYINLTLTE